MAEETQSQNSELLTKFEEFRLKLKNISYASEDKTSVSSQTMKAISEMLVELNKTSDTNIIADLSSAAKQRMSEGKGKFATPTYNVRSPYMEVFINGVSIYPYFIPSDDVSTSGSSLDAEVYQNRQLVQSLNLTFPLSSDPMVINGSLKLFVKDPTDLLDILNPYFPLADIDARESIPVARIKFGWKFAIGNGNTESGTYIMSKELQMLIMGIKLDDAGGGGGFYITLALQDMGSACLQNSCSDHTLLSNYPQEQLRVLIEGLLNVRLFTLDDLLALEAPKTYTKPFTTTFFLVSQNASVRMNSSTAYTVATELAAAIRCRWFTVDNSKLEGEINNEEKIRGELVTLLQSGTTSANKKEEDEKQKANLTARISARCRLYYIPDFPANYYTSSNDTFKGLDITKRGAFLLLPEITDSPDLGSKELPLIYGPGATAFPYLYGSAMNVFNTMLEGSNSGLQSQTFGDVISLNASYNSLLGELAIASDNEGVTTKEIGVRLDTNSVVKTNKVKILTDEERKALVQRGKDKALARIEKQRKIGVEHRNSETRDKLIQRNLNNANSIRWKNTAAPRVTIQADTMDITKNDPRGKSTSSFEPIKSTAALSLVSRLATFLQYPYNISMTVLGDPALMPIGVGAFELLAYAPTDIVPNVGTTQKLNTFLSGVYFPQSISHDIAAGSYTTTIKATKVHKPEVTSKGSFTAQILQSLDSTITRKEATDTESTSIAIDTGKVTSLTDTIFNIDLNKYVSNPFLTGTSSSSSTNVQLSNLIQYIEESQAKKSK